MPSAAIQWREAVRLIELTYGRDHFGHFDWSLELANALEKSACRSGRGSRSIADDLLARWSGNPQIAQRYAVLYLLRCSFTRTPVNPNRRAFTCPIGTGSQRLWSHRRERCPAHYAGESCHLDELRCLGSVLLKQTAPIGRSRSL